MACVMVISMFAGCGGNTATENSSGLAVATGAVYRWIGNGCSK